MSGEAGDTGREGPFRWLGPTIAWAVMVTVLGLLVLVDLKATGAMRFYGALGLSAAMLLTLAFGLVGLSREERLTKLVGGAAVFFIGLMFFMSFLDLLTRLR